MTEIQKTNPMGSQKEQLAAIKAYAGTIGVADWMVEIGPNGVPRLTAPGTSSPHRDNYYFNLIDQRTNDDLPEKSSS